jgi:hypothetical protein
MRGSLLRTGGTAALAAFILCRVQPVAQARDGLWRSARSAVS